MAISTVINRDTAGADRTSGRPRASGSHPHIAQKDRSEAPRRRLNDRYQLGAVLGQGSLGTTYRGYDVVMKRPVAVKLLSERYAHDSAFNRRFTEVAESAARLTHPNIVAILDSGVVDGRAFLVTELIEGQSLRELLLSGGKRSIEQCTRIALQLIDALTCAHRHYIAHGDLRPENILLDEQWNVKVADFGLVRVAVAADQTLLGSAICRAAYIPPEQLARRMPDERTDVYGIGVLLYELLTGMAPFSSRDVLSRERPPPIPPRRLRPDVPWPLDRAVMCALAPDLRDGFLSVHEFGLALAGQPASRAEGCPASAPVRQTGLRLRSRASSFALARQASRRCPPWAFFGFLTAFLTLVVAIPGMSGGYRIPLGSISDRPDSSLSVPASASNDRVRQRTDVERTLGVTERRSRIMHDPPEESSAILEHSGPSPASIEATADTDDPAGTVVGLWPGPSQDAKDRRWGLGEEPASSSVASTPAVTTETPAFAPTLATATPPPSATPPVPGRPEHVRVANTDEQGANLREEPSIGAAWVKTVREGGVLDVIGPDREAGGRVWRNVRVPADGTGGWIAAEFLTMVTG